MPFVGDYYVWMNTVKSIVLALSDPTNKTPVDHLLPIPDLMHVSLNAQEAIIRHGFSILHRMWTAAYSNAPFQPFKIRPIRRIALLRMMAESWRRVRVRVTAFLASMKDLGTSTQWVLMGAMIWLFDEAVRLALNAPALLVSGVM